MLTKNKIRDFDDLVETAKSRQYSQRVQKSIKKEGVRLSKLKARYQQLWKTVTREGVAEFLEWLETTISVVFLAITPFFLPFFTSYITDSVLFSNAV